MRIPLNIENLQGSLRITLNTIFKYKRITVIKFIIDTGSPFSLLSEMDIKKIGIPLNRTEHDRVAYGLGGPGNQVNLKEIKDVELIMNDDRGVKQALKSSTFCMAYSPRNNSIVNHSLIGLDFLKEQKMNLIISLENNKAYMETEF